MILIQENQSNRFYYGLALAVSSSGFIGVSLIITKKALLSQGGKRAGEGGYGYLKTKLWWIGMILMASGESLNFAAYAFAPATLVTPLGALSVLVSTILSSSFLGERLTASGKLGCSLCLLGTVVLVISAPHTQTVSNIQQLRATFSSIGSLLYIIVSGGVSLILMLLIAPLYGKSHVLVYISICSLLGSLSVLACKGLGVVVRESLSSLELDITWQQWVQQLVWPDGPITLYLTAMTVTCICIQMVFLNKALDTFNAAIVTSVYYVGFTFFVLLSSVCLWSELAAIPRDHRVESLIICLCAFLSLVLGVFFMTGFVDAKSFTKSLNSEQIQSST